MTGSSNTDRRTFRSASPSLTRSDLHDGERQHGFLAIFHAPSRRQGAVGDDPLQQTSPIEVRGLRDGVYPPRKAAGGGRRRAIRVAEDVRVVERALAVQALRIDGEPAAPGAVQDVAVMDVAVPDHHVLLFGEESSRRTS